MHTLDVHLHDGEGPLIPSRGTLGRAFAIEMLMKEMQGMGWDLVAAPAAPRHKTVLHDNTAAHTVREQYTDYSGLL
jgi:hypothetical protein